MSASRPGRSTLEGRASGTNFLEGWVDPIASLDDTEIEDSWPYRDSNSDPSVLQPVASRYTDCANTTLSFLFGYGFEFVRVF
jgi:hypothetical protein